MLDAIIIKLRTTPQDLHQVWAQNANANGGPHLNSKLRNSPYCSIRSRLQIEEVPVGLDLSPFFVLFFFS